jgi:hypothetical protein
MLLRHAQKFAICSQCVGSPSALHPAALQGGLTKYRARCQQSGAKIAQDSGIKAGVVDLQFIFR